MAAGLDVPSPAPGGPLPPRWWRTTVWMRRGPRGRAYTALELVDVDLDDGQVSRIGPLPAGSADGVLVCAWLHGDPVGTFSVPGRPDAMVPSLVPLTRSVLERQVLEHLLNDALATPDGLARARREGLSGVPHPEPGADARTLTVAVCTRDRPDGLRDCLDALGRLVGPAPDVLVVDNASSDDRTRRVVAEHPGVRYVREPRRGLDWARNRALLESSSDIVAFTDDDVLVHPRWVAGIRKAFREEPAAAAVTGLVLPAELDTPAQVLFELVGGFGRGYRRKWFAAAVRAGEVAAEVFPGMGGAGTGANMALLREPALALGGFDPALDVGTPTGGGGDLEMFFRVVAAGHLLVYEPTAVIRHVHRATVPQLRRQMRGHGTGSYSIYAGAGRRYGPLQAHEFTRFALWWAYRRHVRGHVRALVRPGAGPVALVNAESRGAVSALREDLYGRAQAQAAAEDAEHPGEPTAPPLVHPPGARGGTRTAAPVVTVDLVRDRWVPDGGPHGVAADGSRRVWVRVLRDGRPEDVFAVGTGGTGLSPARLRWELVHRLGPALLAPGTGWQHLTEGSGTPGRPLESSLATAVSRPAPRLDPGVPVTVLLATRDRPEPLGRCLKGLLAGPRQRPLQVVVVDNSADPGRTRAVVREAAGPLDAEGAVVVVHEPRPGLSRARNAGMAAVTGEVVVFVDDDVVVRPDWLENLLGPFVDARVGAVTGNVVAADLTGLEAQLFEEYGGLGRGPHRRVFAPDWLTAGSHAAPTWNIGATANAAFRRDVLLDLGPWVESLGAGRPAGVGEDTEYFYRVLRSGLSIAYEPTAVVLHHHRGDRASLAAQLRAYSAGHVAYHLEVLARYGDLRGLRRVLGALPRHHARRLWRSRRRPSGDYPTDLLGAEVRGYLGGVPAWLRSRRDPGARSGSGGAAGADQGAGGLGPP